MSTYDDLALGGAAVTRERAHAVFGQALGLVALTVGCAALGAQLTGPVPLARSHLSC